MNLPRIAPERLAAFLGLMLLAWQPFASGARLPSLLLFLLGIWMIWRGRIEFSDLASKRLGFIFALLLGPVLISLPTSLYPRGGIEVALVLVLYYVAGLALLQGLKTATDHVWLTRWLRIVLLIWLADGYIQYVFGRDMLGIPMGEDFRIFGPFAGNLHLGIFLTVLMPVMLWSIAKDRPLVALVIMGAVGFVAGMSGARSNMLFFLLGCVFMQPRFNLRYRVFLTLSAVGVLTLSTAYSPTTLERMNRLTELGQKPEISLFQSIDNKLSGRLTIWETAYEMFKDRPLTGVGVKAFAEVYDRYATRPDDPFRSGGSYVGGVYHAHQMYVSVAAESGVVGLAGLCTIIALCVTWFRKATSEQRMHAAPYGAGLAIVAFPMQSQPVLFVYWWFPIILLLLGGMLAGLSGAKESLNACQ